VLIVPYLSDNWLGRFWVIVPLLVLQLGAQVGLLFTKNIDEAYIYLFIIGAAFPGRVLLAITNLIEFTRVGFHFRTTWIYMWTEPVIMVLITLHYQFLDRNWVSLQVVGAVLTALCILYFAFFVPESPKWLYTKLRYAESRQVLRKVAKFNMQEDQFIADNFGFRFDSEIGEARERSLSEGHSVSEYKMPTSRYFINLVVMTIQWSAVSFSFYLVQFMTKYYEGNLFANYYLDGLAGIVGIVIAHPIYLVLKMRYTYLLSTALTIVFVLLLFLFQERYLSSSFVTKLGVAESGHPRDSREDQEHNLSYLIPAVVFLAKIFINQTFTSVYYTSFNEDMIFPFYKRSTATGICNFIARLLTIFSPMIAEFDRPLPAIFLLSMNGIAFLASFFFPSRQEEIEFDEKY
jgi:hypothetical protein